jgi:hypothetical protein
MRTIRATTVASLLVSSLLAAATGAAAPLSPLASPATASFTYQGRLSVGGTPANGPFDFQFTLYDQAVGGLVVGGPANSIVAVPVVNGLFTVTLSFAAAFQGEARWIQITVRPGGIGGDYTPLSPRQPITAAPYASGLVVPLFVHSSAAANTISASNSHTDFWSAVQGVGRVGVYGGATEGQMGWGVIGTYGPHDFIYGAGVLGSSDDGYGVAGYSAFNTGVYGLHAGSSGTSPGVLGTTNSNTGEAAGIRGVLNTFTPGAFAAGVRGVSLGVSGNGIGVYGETESGYGVFGKATTGHAAYFAGKVHVNGTLTKTTGTFKIDHPQDPENRYLSHSFVESPDMKNVYDGVVALDGGGCATVELPSYFGALNRDFRYQLTAIGAPAPLLHVAREIEDGSFAIGGGTPGMKVSWQVTGIRRDAAAQLYAFEVEEEKPLEERGRYLNPLAFGQPVAKTIGQSTRAAQQP